MSAKDRFEAALRRAEAKDNDPARRKKSAENHAYYAASKLLVPAVCGHGVITSNKKVPLCQKCIDSIRFTQRMPAGLSDEASSAVQKIIESGVIKRAKTHAELAAAREERVRQEQDAAVMSKPWQSPPQRGPAAQIREALEIEKPVKVTPDESPLPKDVDLSDPNQRTHLANCVLLKGMNFEAGVRAAYPTLKAFEVSIVAQAAQADRAFQADLQEAASQRGISEQDKQAYLGILWRHASSVRPQDYQDRGTALRLLGRVFLPEGKAVMEKPQPLIISELDDGLKRMGIDASQAQNVQELDVDVSEFEEDDRGSGSSSSNGDKP